MRRDEPQSRAGTVLAGKYRLGDQLGAGGMGAVYRAEHVVTRRQVAVKLMHARLDWSESDVQRFVQEARVTTGIGHPNIVDVLDAGDDAGVPFVVFELLQGESAASMIARLGRVAVEDAVSICGDVLDALAAAHALGVVHRDIKPDNVFLARGPRARVTKLLDFGISKVVGPMGARTRGITVEGLAIGTIDYMSPEQASAVDAIDERTDLWSVGVMLYQMLAGRLPFEAASDTGVLVGIMMNPHQPLTPTDGVSWALASVVDRALAKNRADRFATANEMLAALSAAVPSARAADSWRTRASDGEPGGAGPKPQPDRDDRAPITLRDAAVATRSRRSRAAAIAGVVGLAALAAISFALVGRAPAQPPLATATAARGVGAPARAPQTITAPAAVPAGPASPEPPTAPPRAPAVDRAISTRPRTAPPPSTPTARPRRRAAPITSIDGT